jgi:hypothetical protein
MGDPKPRREVAINPIVRSSTGSDYPIERSGKLPGSKYRLVGPPPQQLYNEPITKDFKDELWSTNEDKNEAKKNAREEGGLKVHLLDDANIVQALNNQSLNTGIQEEIITLRRLKRSWRYIAEVFLSRFDSLVLSGTKEELRDYQVLYFKLLNLIPSGLLEDPHHDMEERLYQSIDILGGIDKVGRARRKTRGRKKLRKTIRKSKQ